MQPAAVKPGNLEETGVTGCPFAGRHDLIRSSGECTAIRAINADGGDPRLVLDCPASECNSPRWYPDGTRIAYERLDDATEALVPRFSIWWLDLASSETRPLFQDATFASYSPQFSPDGAWLSYISSADNTLILFNLENSSTVSLPLGPQAACRQ
jgi:Tol biopolymer transport system component